LEASFHERFAAQHCHDDGKVSVVCGQHEVLRKLAFLDEARLRDSFEGERKIGEPQRVG